MIRRLLACVAAALLGCLAAMAAPQANAPPAVEDDVQDVVLLTDQRPVFLRLHLRIDEKPFRAFHQEALDAYLAGLFKHLDADGDGVLSEEEARRMPPPFAPPGDPSTASVHVAFNYRVVDADGDGKVTREELAEYHRQFSGGAVLAQPTARTAAPPSVSAALFALLDTNKDGKLSREELAAAAAVLAPLDADHDELLTPQKLAPSLNFNSGAAPPPAPAMRNPGAARPSLFVLATDDDRAALATALKARYGRGREPMKVPDGPADVELIMRLGKRAPGQARLEVLRPNGTQSAQDVSVRPSADGAALTIGGTRVEVRVNDGQPRQPRETRQRTLELFRGAAGGKGFLTLNEAQAAGFFPNQFALLDQNNDGKLAEGELAAYLDDVQERQARLIAATPALVLSDRGQGLFEWLDQDRDGRLSLRELREAPKLLARLGREAEGEISRDDLPESYQLAVGLGQASLGRAGPEAFTPREAPMLTLDWAAPGLFWFYKMDRNRDGDLSPREFLGTAEDFRRLDADGDGLISREEAERADEVFRKK
jgi:Ca2+-binding EF-hand superfamily protein